MNTWMFGSVSQLVGLASPDAETDPTGRGGGAASTGAAAGAATMCSPGSANVVAVKAVVTLRMLVPRGS